ncbi:ATP-binding protein [Bosea sp. 117]|uniref:ATP-binding protein n=1 Tax=Bosea sp. 117 TaxID=1125973 RepID=UPI000494B92F|nr:ATP-binding protein [Bosea sp. 117]
MTHSTNDPTASATDGALRAAAQAALAAPAPALLVRPDGRVVGASEAARRLFGEVARLPAATTSTVQRIAAGLRPDRAPRLERLRLPGQLAPGTFACTLVSADRDRAVLMVAVGAVQPSMPAASRSEAARPADDASPAASLNLPPEPPATVPAEEAPTAPRPERFVWRTGLDGRLGVVDTRLAAALGRDVGELKGRDWAALGAPEADRAVREGRSFAHLVADLPAAGGEAVRTELGGAPVRGEGMRGFGLILERVAAEARGDEPASGAAPVAEPVSRPPETTPPAGIAASEAPTPVLPPAAEAPSASPKVVPLRAGNGDPQTRPEARSEAAQDGTGRTPWAGLTAGERNAFRELARALGARLEGFDEPELPAATVPAPGAAKPEPPVEAPPAIRPASETVVAETTTVESQPAAASVEAEPAESLLAEVPSPDVVPAEIAPATDAPAATVDGFRRVLADAERPILDRLPFGVVVYRDDRLLYANRALLDWTGHADVAALEAAGGMNNLFGPAGDTGEDDARTLAILSAGGDSIPVEARLMSAPWDGTPALLYVLRRVGPRFDARVRQAELALREAEGTARELRAILDTATDGVVLIDAEGTVISMNRPAEALFGFEASEVQGESFTLLFAPESHRAAIDYLDGLASNGVASVLNDGREVIGRVREGGLIPLFMTVGRIGEDSPKFCAVLRDITQWKRAEEELTEAKRLAERANLAKSDFLAKISHEIRTPLNAIIGFSEVMMEERFGPIENERYRDYLRDIHASGGHLISLINDLLDLSKIEAGKLDLSFTSVPLNEIVQQCMGIMQPQANRERIIIRSSLASDLPPVVADARSIRQIVLNLVSNSIKFTQPGGQVILSTALTDAGEVVLRVRDTGIGMSEADIATAMEPFRQLATSGRAGSGGTGLGLPLTKALAEANRATFAIRSAVDAGTMVEITFPSTRVLAE